MEEERKEQEQLFEDLCFDVVNIARVLPNLTPLDLQTEILLLKNDPDRVTKMIKKHLNFNEERENTLSQDIKIIKRVTPNRSIVEISKDLSDLGSRRNRVQVVLRKYFSPDEENPSKRPLENNDLTSNKMLKVVEPVRKETNDTSDHLIPSHALNSLNIDDCKVNDNTPSTSKLTVEINVTKNNVENVTIEPLATPEDTSQDSSGFNNTVAKEIEDNEEKSTAHKNNTVQDNSDQTKTLFKVVNNLYPDLTAIEMEVILSHLGIDIYQTADDMTLHVVINEIMNHFEKRDKLEQVEAMIDNRNLSVTTNSQSTESSSTEEYDIKDELTHFFTNTAEDINVTSEVVVKQESPYQTDDYTDKNLGLIREICRGIAESEREETFATKSANTIASGTDNWVTSALAQTKNNCVDLSMTSLCIADNKKNIIKPDVVKIENNSRKRPACSTVTSASINNPFEVPQIKQENNVAYNNYPADLTHRSPKRFRETTNCFPPPAKPITDIERPPRDNLKSSINKQFSGSAGHSRSLANNPAPINGEDFVQYLQNRNNIMQNVYGVIDDDDLNFLLPPRPDYNNHQNNPIIPNNINNNNNNFLEDKVVEMPRRSSLLTKQEEKEVQALLCEIGNGKCNACKKCLKKTIALKVRNDLFQRNTDTPESLVEEDAEDIALLDRINNGKQPVIPLVDICDSSSSNSNPLPGTSSTLQPNENHPFYFKIMEMFPDICPDYLRTLCNGKDHSSKTLDMLISGLLLGNYNRRERVNSPAQALDFDEQYKTLLDLFPDADPTYLQEHCERLFEHPNEFKEFVASLLEHKNYPTREEYLKKIKLSAQQKQYTTEFDVKKFLEVIPNPEEFFKNRTVKRNYYDQDYALTFLKNHYCHLSIKDINMVFRDCDHSIVKSSIVLDKIKRNLKSKRKLYPLTNCSNIPLLQEIAYVKNKNEILSYVKEQELEKKRNREHAKNAGLLKTCECCYDDEVMPEEMACCENGHVFCKECVKKGCEVKIGEGKLDFPCLTTCEAKFALQVLQTVLTPKVFSKMAQRKQLEEVKSAGIEELEFCPFCDFATIPAPGDKIFRCLNTDCMKETCRECKEPSHIPLRCDEVEKENDVKLRTYIEDKMTEALVRKCYKCGMKFIKEEGCNKMTCSCGAMMCYVCNQPVKDYKHFNGQGGDQYHLCPLYSDTHKLHMEAVKLSAENAKKELGIANNQLKIDPTANLDQHYKRLASRNPQNLPPGMEQLNPQHIHIRIQEFHLARR